MLKAIFLSLFAVTGLTVLIIATVSSRSFRRIIFTLGLFGCLAAAAVVLFAPHLPRHALKAARRYFRSSIQHKPSLESGSQCSCNFHAAKLPRDRYSLHRSAAQELTNNAFLASESHKKKLKTSGELKSIPSFMGLHIRHLTHSSADLHRAAMPGFKELVDRFNKTCAARGIKNAEFVVSSVTRTEAQQKQIRKRYSQSATKGTSAHSFGAAIDIVQVKSTSNCRAARKALFDVLKNMRAERKLLLCPESRCIHVTFR